MGVRMEGRHEGRKNVRGCREWTGREGGGKKGEEKETKGKDGQAYEEKEGG